MVGRAKILKDNISNTNRSEEGVGVTQCFVLSFLVGTPFTALAEQPHGGSNDSDGNSNNRGALAYIEGRHSTGPVALALKRSGCRAG